MSAPTVEELQAQLTALQDALKESWAPVVYRDIWADEVRLYIDGRDWTMFRGVPAQVGGYQRQEPYTYGPADFAFPQITGLEVDRFGKKGHGLRPVRHGAIVELVPIKDGAPLPRIEWRGFVTSISVADGSLKIHCDGDVSGRLTLRDRQPVVFPIKKDLGVEIYDALSYCGVRLKTRLPQIGLKVTKRGGGSTYLSYVDELLAMTLQLDGDQKTIAATGNGRRYDLVDKDTTTVHATVFYGAAGVNLDVSDDMAEKPNGIYGTGTDPTGQKWINPVAPNFTRGDPPPFPGTLSVGDSGPNVTVLHSKLVGQGYLDRDDTGDGGGYDADTADAVRALQDDAGLPETGVVDSATWDALWNTSATGLSFRRAEVLPLAERSARKKWKRTANGSIYALNPGYDPDVVPVDQTFDHGEGVWKKRARKWSRHYLAKIHDGKNWVGTMSLDGADVFAGEVDGATVNPVPMSARELYEGMNVLVRYFDGDTLFHISGKNVDGSGRANFAIDTRARDLLTVGQLIARNRESRSHPARQWIREQRRPDANSLPIFSELGGRLDEDVPLKGGQWNVVGVPAGFSGTLEHIELHLRDAKAEFVFGVAMRDITPARMLQVAGHPFTKPATGKIKWNRSDVQDRLKKDHLFIYTVGQKAQPCGYYPSAKVGEDGKATNDPITGDWEDDAGVNFHAVDDCAFYFVIYSDRDTALQAGRLAKVQQTEGS